MLSCVQLTELGFEEVVDVGGCLLLCGVRGRLCLESQ